MLLKTTTNTSNAVFVFCLVTTPGVTIWWRKQTHQTMTLLQQWLL